MPAKKRVLRRHRKFSKKTRQYLYSFSFLFLILAILNIPLTTIPDTVAVKSAVTAKSEETQEKELEGEEQAEIAVKPVIKSKSDKGTDAFQEQETEIKAKIENEEIKEVEVSSKDHLLEVKTTDKAGVITALGENGLQNLQVNVKNKDQEIQVQLESKGNKIIFQSHGVTAVSDFPIILNKYSGALAANTAYGNKNLSILPDDAKNVVDHLQGSSNTTSITLTTNPQQGKSDDLLYAVKGKKTGMALGLFPISANIETNIGATTGKVLSTKVPLWYKLFSFLIV